MGRHTGKVGIERIHQEGGKREQPMALGLESAHVKAKGRI